MPRVLYQIRVTRRMPVYGGRTHTICAWTFCSRHRYDEAIASSVRWKLKPSDARKLLIDKGRRTLVVRADELPQ